MEVVGELGGLVGEGGGGDVGVGWGRGERG